MDPREFHRLAERLSGSRDPAELRTATSRAYYAVYNVGAELLNQVVPLSRGAASHGQVQKLLANCGDPQVVQAGSDLGDLHSRRIDADYEMTNRNAENVRTVVTTISEAKHMIETIDRGFGGAGGLAIKKAIQQY